MHLGLVTYNLARDWDLDTLIDHCEQTGFEAVELRTSHQHGVEPNLDAARRAEIVRRFQQTAVRLLSLGTTCEFHDRDPEVVARNVNQCKEFVQLAHDIGAAGVKVRPNGFPTGESQEITLARIGAALRTCGDFAAPRGVQIWLEVHGPGTSELSHIQAILDLADHRNVLACWNSNQADKDPNGSIDENFARIAGRIGSVHINELYRPDYPYRRLFELLRGSGYSGYCLAELAQTSTDPITVMRYYRALFDALGG